MDLVTRFLNYVNIPTASDATSPTCPSTQCQKDLGRVLVKEMQELGLTDARMDENGYVYGTLEANVPGRKAIGLIAHMDVIDTVPCAPMNTRVIENYDGGKIQLAGGEVLDPEVFPDVTRAKGKTLIVTDGKTLLGADDKAGIAEIMDAVQALAANPDLPHGKICIGFTPDEEIGRGADLFDVKGFGADIAYTVDGGAVGSIEYENFNAASGVITVNGVSVHPGAAKDIMKNAVLIGIDFNAQLPADEIPAKTSGYEGFYHLSQMSGNEDKCVLQYIIRDHDRASFENRKEVFKKAADAMNEKYGEGVVVCEVKDSYYNMREIIEKDMSIIRLAEGAFRAEGVEPFATPIRGGTDGCRLSYMGLPCPNMSTGGMLCHGRFECIAIEDMEKMSKVLLRLMTMDQAALK